MKREKTQDSEGARVAGEAGIPGEAEASDSPPTHEAEFERAWTDPGNTRIELDPVDINRTLARFYRTNKPLRFTRTMLWDMEVKKAFRPDLYIPSVVTKGSSRYWNRQASAGEAESFVRCSRQRLWLETSEHGLVLERVFLNPGRQRVTFIGTAELPGRDGNPLRAGDGQPLFHVEHSVDGSELRPLNLWRIVFLTDRRRRQLIERFTPAKDVWLREFIEIYIRRDLKIELNRREPPG